MFQHYLIRSIGLHRGAPRFYLDNTFLSNTEFQPGSQFNVCLEDGGSRVVLRVHREGSRTVSVKSRKGKSQPVIDINNRTDLAAFEGLLAVRVVITTSAVYLLLPASERNRRERLHRLSDRVLRGRSARVASLAHGIGVMSHAAHFGLSRSGLNPALILANEIDVDFLGHARSANNSWSHRTVALGAPLQEVVQDAWLMEKLGPVEVMEAGIPCSGASRSGKSKLGLIHMEAHERVGHLIAPTIMAIARLQPVAIVVENTVPYQSTASADILRKMLRDMCYSVHEVIIDARSHGSVEARVRWFLVAVTLGIEFSLEELEARRNCETAPATVGEMLDEIDDDDPRWRTFDYLFKKEVRDAEEGDCFAMQIVESAKRSVPTIRKGYHKGGSTDPLLRHPTNPDLLRLFTPTEHARFKQVPQFLIDGLSATRAHQGLGQSVVYGPVSELFAVLGTALMKHATSSKAEVASDLGQHLLHPAAG